jgi:hypothetical protein
MEFITSLPVSMALGYTEILEIFTCLTKMATYLPCRNDFDSLELARMIFQLLTSKRGIEDTITTDRGKQLQVDFGIEFAPIVQSLTNFHPLCAC